MEELLERIWDNPDLLRIYTESKGQVLDYKAPIILQKNKWSVADFYIQIHWALVKNLKYAIGWLI